MSEVLCNKPCGYRNGVFCKKDYVMINQFGQCEEWWNKQGNMRQFATDPYYQQFTQSTSSENVTDNKETSEKTSEENLEKS